MGGVPDSTFMSASLESPVALEESVQNRDRKHYSDPHRSDGGAVETRSAPRASNGISRDHGTARPA